MSLEKMYESLTTAYSNDDADWVHYVRDNLHVIMATSEWMELDPFKHNSMKYRLEDFMLEERLSPSIAWILLLINQLGSNLDFIGLTRLRIPDITTIKELRSQYVSVRSNYNEVRG